MSAATLLATARRRKESLMSGKVRITRFTPVTLDTSTLNLLDTDPSDDLIYSGVFRIKSPSAAVLALNSEGLAEQQLVLCLPIEDAGPVQVNDRVEVLDGGYEPGLAGRTFRIAGEFSQSWATEARLPIQGLS